MIEIFEQLSKENGRLIDVGAYFAKIKQFLCAHVITGMFEEHICTFSWRKSAKLHIVLREQFSMFFRYQKMKKTPEQWIKTVCDIYPNFDVKKSSYYF